MILCSLGLLPFTGFAQHSTNAAAEAKLKQLQVAPGLKVELVAAEPLLQNPVAFSVDEHGRFFIAETHRYKKAVFDITQRVPWLLDDLSCRTVADREALLRRHFPGTNFSVLTNDSEIIRLVEDTDGDGRADKSAVIAEGFNAAVSGPAAGILARRGDLWFTCLPDLWRITNYASRFTSPDPAKRKTENGKLASGLGVHISVSGHDLHGLTFGPDGRLYFSLGDRGFELRPGMKHPGFSAEYLRRIAPDTGAVFRCQPDGSELEVFCIGLRNPQGLAFDALGNLFTVDNDTAGPDKCRLLHLVEGGDYGWRISYQHMKNFGPWVTEGLWRGGAGDILPTSGEAAQGPAGFAFYPGTGLPDRYTNHFFICDFPGGVWSLSLKARGASFELAAREKFLWNLLPTHCAFGPDGALYVSDWVEGWSPPDKGRLYRVSDPAQAGSAQLAETKRLLADGMAKRPEAELARLLAHDSMQVRLAAQFELAARTKSDRDPAVRELVQVALKSTNLFARLHAMWGMGQVAEKLKKDELTSELAELTALLEDAEPIIRANACGLFQKSAFINAQEKVARLVGDSETVVRLHAADAASKAMLPHTVWRGHQTESERLGSVVQEKLFALKVYLTGSGFPLRAGFGFTHPVEEAKRLFASTSSASDEQLFHGGVKFLTSTWADTAARRGSAAKMGYSYEEFVSHKDAAVRLGALRALRRLSDPAIAQFLRDPDPRLVLEAARAINDAGIEPAYPALAALLPVAAEVRRRTETSLAPTNPPPHVGGYEAILRRALNAHYRLGHATNAQALADFAAGRDARPSGAAVPAAGSRSGVPPEPATGTVAKTPAAVGTTAPLPSALDDLLRAEALFLLGAWEVQPATPGNVPAKIASVDGHGSTPLVNPENWPGWFDRVCGLWRPLPPRTADDARAALRPHLASLLVDRGVAVPAAASRPGVSPEPATGTVAKTPAVGTTAPLLPGTNTALAAIAAVEKLALVEAAPQLAELVKAPTQPTPIRVAALRTLGELSRAGARASSPSLPRSGGEGRGEEARPAGKTSSPLPNPLPARASQGEGAGSARLLTLHSDSVTLALSDPDAAVRREAVKLAAAANPTAAVPLLGRVLTEEKDIRLRQAALTALGDLPGPAADTLLSQQLTLLADKKLSPELHLELIEAAAKRPALANVGRASSSPLLLNAHPPSEEASRMLALRLVALAGGDPAEGKRIFFEHPGAQCLRCHAVRGNGGIVGPGLTGVGKRLTREQLLESIVLPNQTIAAGFENATLVLKSGVNHNGLVKSETSTEVVLDSPEDGKLTLKKGDIEKRIRGLSAMPEGVDKLMTRRELRDLVEYLAGLK